VARALHSASLRGSAALGICVRLNGGDDMSDSLIALLLLAVIAGGYFFLRKNDLLVSHVEVPQVTAQNSGSHKRSSRYASHGAKSKTSQGAKHGEKSNRDDVEQAANQRQDEGSSDDVAEAEKLSSIYQGKQGDGSAVTADNGVAENREGIRPTVVHGVPVDAYVLSRKDAINTSGMPQDTPQGLRVFLQCMELKKEGASPLDEKNCHSLAFRDLVTAGTGVH
jgi:hypothetical protein